MTDFNYFTATPENHANLAEYAHSLKPQIIQAFQQINAKVEDIALKRRGLGPGDYHYLLIITSPDFQDIPQLRRQTDTERKLKKHLPPEIIKSLTYLTFTPEEYKDIEGDHE